MWTSGSTGEAKGVMVTHRNIRVNTEDILGYAGIGTGDRAMTILPFYYCFGTSLLHTHLMAGASLVLNNRFLFAEKMLDEMEQTGCTGLAGVPATYQVLLRKTRFAQRRFPALRWLQQAGGKLPDALIGEIRLLDYPAPAGVQDDGIPEHDEERAVFLGVPAPESPPGLVGPDAAQNGAHETEEGGETNNAIDHPPQRAGHLRRQGAGEETAHDVNDGQQPGHKHRGVAQGDHDDVGGEPQVGVQHGLEHFHGVAAQGQVMGNDQGGKADESRHDQAQAALEDSFQDDAKEAGFYLTKKPSFLAIGVVFLGALILFTGAYILWVHQLGPVLPHL